MMTGNDGNALSPTTHWVMYVTWTTANQVNGSRVTHNREYVYPSFEKAMRDYIFAMRSVLIEYVQLCKEELA